MSLGAIDQMIIAGVCRDILNGWPRDLLKALKVNDAISILWINSLYL